jgi:SAM-dependent methyltransferase
VLTAALFSLLRFALRVDAFLRRGPPRRGASVDALLALTRTLLEGASPEEVQRFHAKLEDHAHESAVTLAYALQVNRGWHELIRKHRGELAGARVLELGPGHTLVPGLLLQVQGARSYVGADLYSLAAQEADLYRRLRTRLAREIPLAGDGSDERARTLALKRFDAAVNLAGETATFDPEKVAYRSPVDAASLPFEDGGFDVVLSNAAFEHFRDPGAAVRECARVLAPGGTGLHQIDLRDHRDFKKPIRFLRHADAEWSRLQEGLPQHMNRWRKQDFDEAFRAAGLELVAAEVTLSQPVSPEVRSGLDARFRERSLEDLEALSVFFAVRRPHGP